MTWQRDWAEELLAHGSLPASSPLPERVQKRLAWQAVAEFTYMSHRGRNLERIGKAALDGELGTDLESRLTSMNYHAGEVAPRLIYVALTRAKQRAALFTAI